MKLKKVIAIITLVIAFVVLYCSTSKNMMQVITNFREGAPANAWWGDPNKEGVGDLVRMSYLEDVAKFQDTNIVNFKYAD